MCSGVTISRRGGRTLPPFAVRRLGHDRVPRTINGQRGMFSTLDLSEQVPTTLQRRGARYLGLGRRINFAGLNAENI